MQEPARAPTTPNMTQPRCTTEPQPIAAVPTDKLYTWTQTLDYLRRILQSNIDTCTDLNIPTLHESMIMRDLNDLIMFMSMSYYEYADWLGMDSESIRVFREHRKLQQAVTAITQGEA